MRIPKSSHLPKVALLLLLLIAQVFGVAGQSGRKPAMPAPQSPEAPVNPETAFVPDPNRDEYQLIFSKIPEAEKVSHTLGSWERWEFHEASFSDDLTRVGMKGYRLVSIALSPRLAIMRRAEHQYEYAVVEIRSRRRMFPNDPKFGLTYASWARKGFRVADYFVLYDFCDGPHWVTSDGSDRYEPVDCMYESQMVLERQKNAETPRNYEIVNGPLTFSKKKLVGGLAEELNNARETNLYPTHLLTKFQLLTQSPADTGNIAADEYEMEIVSGDVKKRVNALAQRGYRLILRPLGFDAAVMHRKKGATNPASYIWIGEKRLEQELPRLQEQGAIYRMNYGCTSVWGAGPMILEQPQVRDIKRREYKVLAIEFKEIDNFAKKREELNRLTKEGFEVRDFFACDMSDKKTRRSRVKILLERVSSK